MRAIWLPPVPRCLSGCYSPPRSKESGRAQRSCHGGVHDDRHHHERHFVRGRDLPPLQRLPRPATAAAKAPTVSWRGEPALEGGFPPPAWAPGGTDTQTHSCSTLWATQRRARPDAPQVAGTAEKQPPGGLSHTRLRSAPASGFGDVRQGSAKVVGPPRSARGRRSEGASRAGRPRPGVWTRAAGTAPLSACPQEPSVRPAQVARARSRGWCRPCPEYGRPRQDASTVLRDAAARWPGLQTQTGSTAGKRRESAVHSARVNCFKRRCGL
jgi:hypothetical protein